MLLAQTVPEQLVCDALHQTKPCFVIQWWRKQQKKAKAEGLPW